MNPYASFLEERNPFEVIAGTPARLDALFNELGAQRIEESPARGKWSAREIVCHLADTELVFAFRLRQTLAEDHHVIQPFDQEKWAATYSAYNARAALTTFSALRDWNVKFINAVTPQALSKPVTHPERGTMTFQAVIETMGGHDLNHLRQIEAICARYASAG